jgi:hypothetical protein
MKTDPDQNRDEALLDAVLGGEPWAEVNAAVKRAALAEFHARQRRRRIRFWAMQAAAGVVFVGGAVWLAQRAAPSSQPKEVAVVAPAKTHTPAEFQNSTQGNPSNEVAVTPGPEQALVANTMPVAPEISPEKTSAPATPKSPAAIAADLAKLPEYITEEQMLALFPKGSCTIAEIDGQTQLIFFDRKIEEEGAPYQPGS